MGSKTLAGLLDYMERAWLGFLSKLARFECTSSSHFIAFCVLFGHLSSASLLLLFLQCWFCKSAHPTCAMGGRGSNIGCNNVSEIA